ncbi:hypothetical protein DFH08DRAFT_1013931 [Mycena albidolilacea]|uniref:Uncharacterized protein n=1 Tax=Mycena albidolilacea TaxID=1033008 RepID=A0AAD6ZTK1_9AGAR|nr:hypothetical protein DFH08DRAFT_1013931 [Mycena albidolilacea]
MPLDTKKWYLILCAHRFFRFIALQRGFPLSHFLFYFVRSGLFVHPISSQRFCVPALAPAALAHTLAFIRERVQLYCVLAPLRTCLTLPRARSAAPHPLPAALCIPLHPHPCTRSARPVVLSPLLLVWPARPHALGSSFARIIPACPVALPLSQCLAVLCTSASRTAPNPAPCSSYVPRALALEPGACSIRPLVHEHRSPLPGSPAGPQSAHPLTAANHSANHSAHHALAPRTSRSTLNLALCARCLLAPTFCPTHLFPRRHSTAHRARMSRTPCPPAPRWLTLTPRPMRVSIPLAFAPAPHPPAAAAALARMSCVCTFAHARRAHTPLAPRPQGMRQDASRVQTLLCTGALHAVAPEQAALQRCGDPHALDVVEPLIAWRRFGCRTPLDLLACALLERSLRPHALLLYHANKPHHHILHTLSPMHLIAAPGVY